ncbi:MAG: hypothetical protein WD059_10055 [Balneolaceae bacterium]
MKYFSFLILLSFMISCSSEKTKSEIEFFPSLELRDGFYYKKDSNEPFTGSTESTYSTGDPYVSASFKDGKFDGRYTAWHLSGHKMGESNYANGIKEGISIAWHENGNKASVVNFKNDKREGKLEIFLLTGDKSTEAFFKADNLDSTYTRWDMDGNVISVEMYEEGVLVE